MLGKHNVHAQSINTTDEQPFILFCVYMQRDLLINLELPAHCNAGKRIVKKAAETSCMEKDRDKDRRTKLNNVPSFREGPLALQEEEVGKLMFAPAVSHHLPDIDVDSAF